MAIITATYYIYNAKPQCHLAEYIPDCLRWRQLSYREQSETDRHGNRLCRRDMAVGTGGGAGEAIAPPPPQYFANQRNLRV